MNSASLCSLAGRYDNPIPPRFLAPIDFLKIPAQRAREGEISHLGDAPALGQIGIYDTGGRKREGRDSTI
jgi:hypothetical protein